MIALLAIISIVGIGLTIARRLDDSDARADDWASERMLALDAGSRALIADYLGTTRWLRITGVLVGVGAALLTPSSIGFVPDVLRSPWLPGIIGYLLGTVAGEVALRRPRGSRAAVRVRTLDHYLSPWAKRAERLVAAVALVVIGIGFVVPDREAELSPYGESVGLLVGVVVVLLGAESLQRWIVRRPQPVVSAAMLAADDAIRRASVHAIAGASLGLQSILAGGGFWALALSDVQMLRWTMWVPALASLGIALGCCTMFDDGRWQRWQTPVTR